MYTGNTKPVLYYDKAKLDFASFKNDTGVLAISPKKVA